MNNEDYIENLDDILTKRVKELRKEAKLSQYEFAKILKISRPTVSQIENGSRKVTLSDIMRLANAFNIQVEEILEKKPAKKDSRSKQMFESFGAESFGAWLLDEKDNKPAKKTKRKKEKFSKIDKNKYKEVIIYILNKAGARPNMGESFLYKVLYFIDFDFYEKYKSYLIGETYIKRINGPAPFNIKDVIKEMINAKDIVKLDNKYFSMPQTKYLPLKNPDLSKFKANEIEVIDGVLFKMSDMNLEDADNYSQNQIQFINAEINEKISYE